MKTIWSKTKPIKTGKQSEMTYCLRCKDYTQNFRPEKVKMKNRVIRKISVLFVGQINQDF